MFSKRLLVSGGLLLTVSGCNHLLPPSAQYASLAPGAVPVESGEGPMPEVTVPGTLLGGDAVRRGSTEPYRALNRTAAARARWEAQPRVNFATIAPPANPADLTAAESASAASPAAASQEPPTTASLRAARAAAAAGKLSPSYDREKMMNDLLTDGAKAAKPICDRC
ncbi:hypothetical protein [Methylobacterium oxalidis]|uniref:Lipoprotein n=1 Tax=Methylobacterium oxalidis TaxID=944322 RepID=A0A512J355_9HYPH|nr:hypothetical protein [Methylobacterium oxalidis]GEP04289.1 hypothetical protein MOX02_23270 [Methylobacterium oxalidis]GJE32996.1 hypothetical protein LDDCCGHA_3195 [Methylobacterium oxalidis]GLS67192.1 hypothetical protein GCM10007888_55750 [Methylobacterium oxalidis]